MNRALLVVLGTLTCAIRLDAAPGLVVTFADGKQTVARLDPTVALGLAAGESPHPRLAGLTSAKWAGTINVVTAGTYTFRADAAGGTLAVSVNGKPISLGSPVELVPGVQPFAATFMAAGGGPARVELRWAGPGFRDEPIPYFFFGHQPADRPGHFADDVKYDHGRFLFEELACAKCHATGEKTGLVERSGPSLTEIGKRVYPGWLDAWLADPAKLRPHTTMPKLFADTPSGRAERYAVGQYLLSLGGPLTEPKSVFASNEFRRSVGRGEVLFTTAGCAACHGKKPAGAMKKTDDDDDDKPPPAFDPTAAIHGVGTATGPQWVYALGALGSKTRPEELAKYLQDPLKTNPHGRMPNMALTATDARDLANHLCRQTDEAVTRAAVKPPGGAVPAGGWVALGKKLVVSKGCVNCHAVEPEGKPFAAKPAVRPKDTAAGCLAPTPDAAKVPVYSLTADQRAALAAFLKSGPPAGKSSTYDARTSFRRFGCLNCHSRDGEGGIGTELGDAMRLLEKAENADEVQPPRLTGIGHKARPAWLQSVLTGGGRARPWMTLRMPQYGPQNVGQLPESLAALEGVGPDKGERKTEFTAAAVEAGRTLSGKGGHGCISCHDISGVTGGGTRGPDLALTSQRVRREWYDRWMHAPQRLAPGTKMPSILIEGKSLLTTVFDGDGPKQIDALWAYLALGPGLPLPSGMDPPKGLILPVKDRPELLRTFLPDGAGSRAVAVGYPGGVAVAFDAHACRLAYAWEGNFLDASPVWNNRGGAPAKLLGPKFLTAPAGHPWAVTPADGSPPDFGERAGDYAWGAAVPDNKIYPGPVRVAFDGYSLDTVGNPTFRYRVADDLTVADTPRPVRAAVAAGLARQFVVDVPDGKVAWLLGGTAAKEPRRVGSRMVLPQPADRAVVLDLTAAPAGSEWRVVKAAGGWEVVLRVPAGKAEVGLTTWALPRDDPGLLAALPGK